MEDDKLDEGETSYKFKERLRIHPNVNDEFSPVTLEEAGRPLHLRLGQPGRKNLGSVSSSSCALMEI